MPRCGEIWISKCGCIQLAVTGSWALGLCYTVCETVKRLIPDVYRHLIENCFGCKDYRKTIEVLKVYHSRDISVYVMYYVYVMSLLTEYYRLCD